MDTIAAAARATAASGCLVERRWLFIVVRDMLLTLILPHQTSKGSKSLTQVSTALKSSRASQVA